MIRWFIFRGFWIRIAVVCCGILSFCIQSMHLLRVLLRLELIMLGLFFRYVISQNLVGGDIYLGLVILTLRVCEARLGLSLLISIIRSHGTDYVTGFSIY